ncbi:hypothetical protein [Sphingobacterium sp. UGAL515B_05]|uniref:hypothetical protein n=1 Tax=Sphingobacterium sp. UGAL515B_05 TaxID=2986767 RepID=UPI0029547972|nr:hypothetical protein [Sphingobacterium sp. UGAL515B_05]WON93746.1 hypothetical protein OK025_21165 [Sphingobacterium sp. UGAL515B_05]
MNDIPECLIPHVKGGGSLTALPVIETVAGDLGGFIPTNVISITNAQIYLESNLFNAGISPEINVGLSQSRVGGNAQIKSMTKVAQTIKIDHAQYREIEAFLKLGSDIDSSNKLVLDKGSRNVELLKQDERSPIKVKNHVAVLFAGTRGLLNKIPKNKIAEFETAYLYELRLKFPEILISIKNGIYDDTISSTLESKSCCHSKKIKVLQSNS